MKETLLQISHEPLSYNVIHTTRLYIMHKQNNLFCGILAFLFIHNFTLNVSCTYSTIGKKIRNNAQDDQGKSGNFEMENLWEP